MALVDTGLVARYFFDEAASGSTPTEALDGSGVGSAVNLTLTYGGNLNYAETSGNRGLQSTSDSGAQRARYAINNASDKVRDNLHGTQTATIVVVLSATSISSSGGRIFGINDRAGNNGRLMLRGTSLSDLGVMWNDVLWVHNISITSNTRTVFHIVIDTTEANVDDRIVVYKNGTPFSASTDTPPNQNDTLSLPSDVDLSAFNRESSGNFDRSFTGILYGASLHDAAFTPEEVEEDYDAWVADDDTPAGGEVTGSGAIALPEISIAGAGVRRANGTGAIVLPTMEVSGAGTRHANGAGAITLPEIEVAGTGAVEGSVSGSGDLTLPSLEVAGAGVRQANGAGAITLPDLELSGTGERSISAAGAIVLPEMQVSGAGARQVTGSGSLLLPALEVAGAGEVIGQASGAGALLLPALQVTGVGYRTIVGAGAITLPELVVFGLPPGYGVEISRIQYTLKAGGVQFGLRHGDVAFSLN